MNEHRFPAGWDEQRVKRLIAELDARTDEEWIAADEAAAADEGDQAVIAVPANLLPGPASATWRAGRGRRLPSTFRSRRKICVAASANLDYILPCNRPVQLGVVICC